MGTENRRFSRFKYKMPAELETDGEIIHIDEISDLGIGGCLLPVKMNKNPGTFCTLKIRLGSDDFAPLITIGCEIARLQDNCTALKFIRIDPESLAHLHRIALYNSPDPEMIEEEIRRHPGLK
jgi:hypothetical protein